MTTVITIAFTMGLIGSLHCLGMCGPLALSLPIQHHRLAGKLTGALLYNLGRVTTYATAGLAFGLLGQTMSFAGAQRWISLIMGLLILVYIVIPKDYGSESRVARLLNGLFLDLRFRMGQLFSSKAQGTLFVIGLLNGLLPCGLVYLALASAVATGQALHGALFMAFFGLGTLPAMFGISLFGNFMRQGIRTRLRRAVPAFMAVMAMLLILRGLSLGIPYLSPAMEGKEKTPACCTKPS
ncbi:MAG TPA: sulfite exporter TauE/SafE family protein [Lacibacter sp.]|nr:sulfite exporter TauE/SafE family protein [Lacibacter sp.]HMO88289.1 sulfite exporter TauE/SafE family protein [Lacibacter sp.]HMP87103.1 sulfite exporter TauE/SafE family protein [Lacibacter sp.]